MGTRTVTRTPAPSIDFLDQNRADVAYQTDTSSLAAFRSISVSDTTTLLESQGPPTARDLTFYDYTGSTRPTTSNTGVPSGTTLTDVTGDQILTTAGVTYTRQRFLGRVLLRAANLTFVECEFVGTPEGWFGNYPSAGGNSALADCNHTNCDNALFKDCTLIPQTPSEYLNCLIGHDYHLIRCRMERGVDGAGVYNSNSGKQTGPTNVIIEGSLITNLMYQSPDANQSSDNHTHNDGVQMQGGTGTRLWGNDIQCRCDPTVGTGNPANSDSSRDSDYYPSATGQAIAYTPNVSAISGTDIAYNWLDYGAASITIAKGGFAVSNAGYIHDNQFGTNQPSISGGAKRPIQFLHSGMTATGLPTNATGTSADTNNNNTLLVGGAAVTVFRFTTEG